MNASVTTGPSPTRRPVHPVEAVHAALERLSSHTPRTWEAWREVLREAALDGPCGWCGGDGRGIAVEGCATLLFSTSGCPCCRGTGSASDAACRLLAEYPGGAVAIAARLDREAQALEREVDAVRVLRDALRGHRTWSIVWCRTRARVRVRLGRREYQWRGDELAEAMRFAACDIRDGRVS